MPRKRTPSFIPELPLRTSPADERACAIVLDAARNIANAVLGQGLRRLEPASPYPIPTTNVGRNQLRSTSRIQLGIQINTAEERRHSGAPREHQRAHSDHPMPTWMGESVGHYEGDTMLIDTIGQKVGPLSMVDRFGAPFSGALHVIERYQLIDGTMARDLQLKHERAYFGAGRSSPGGSPYGRGDIVPDATKPRLQVEITVDDPAAVTRPWTGLVTYRHGRASGPKQYAPRIPTCQDHRPSASRHPRPASSAAAQCLRLISRISNSWGAQFCAKHPHLLVPRERLDDDWKLGGDMPVVGIPRLPLAALLWRRASWKMPQIPRFNHY
jgi:hypothetical protein